MHFVRITVARMTRKWYGAGVLLVILRVRMQMRLKWYSILKMNGQAILASTASQLSCTRELDAPVALGICESTQYAAC